MQLFFVCKVWRSKPKEEETVPDCDLMCLSRMLKVMQNVIEVVSRATSRCLIAAFSSEER